MFTTVFENNRKLSLLVLLLEDALDFFQVLIMVWQNSCYSAIGLKKLTFDKQQLFLRSNVPIIKVKWAILCHEMLLSRSKDRVLMYFRAFFDKFSPKGQLWVSCSEIMNVLVLSRLKNFKVYFTLDKTVS